MNRYKLYTGPTLTEGVANLLKTAGLSVQVVGTENVYVLATSVAQVLDALPQGGGWTYKDVQDLGPAYYQY